MPHKKSVFHSAILTVSMRWTDRLIGLISMMVLARLLVPADFGVIAMASLAVGLFEVFLDLGVNIALIQNNNADKDDYDTAWSLRLVQAGLLGILIFMAAPLAATYFNNANVTDVLRVMAITIIIGGLENIGIVSFQKNMEFGRDFKFFFYKRITGFLITLIVAFLLHSYWAMVLGAMSGRIAGVLLSYGMHSHRPHFSFARLRHIWSFSQWVLVRNIGIYFDSRTDKLLVGHRTDATITGTYTLADEVAAMPTTELLAPLGRVLFPAFVKKRDDPVAFAQTISLAIGVQGLVAIPACVGLILVSNDAVLVLLGEKWIQAIPFIQIMAITNLLFALTHSGGYALLAMGKVKIQALVAWLQATMYLLTAVFLIPTSGAMGLSTIRLAVVATGSLVLIRLVLHQIKTLKATDYFSPLIRPALATMIMTVVIYFLHIAIPNVAPLIRLASQLVIGGTIYGASIYAMWVLSGRTEGAESYLLKNIFQHRK